MPNASELPRKPNPGGIKAPAGTGLGAKKAPAKPGLPGQPGQQPGDEWGEDNPGNQHGVGVDDHVFFHRDGAGPHAGKVVAHGVHGCQVDDAGGQRHKVRWSRVLGLKQRAVKAGQVVDRGEAGAILQHPDGRRVFVAGDLGLPEDPAKFSDVAGLENAGRLRTTAPQHPTLRELEPFARKAGDDLAKSFAGDHECEGAALCRVCAGRRERAAGANLVKAIAPGLDALEVALARLRRPR